MKPGRGQAKLTRPIGEQHLRRDFRASNNFVPTTGATDLWVSLLQRWKGIGAVTGEIASRSERMGSASDLEATLPSPSFLP